MYRIKIGKNTSQKSNRKKGDDTWFYKFQKPRFNKNGGRRYEYKAGFPTKLAAEDAAEKAYLSVFGFLATLIIYGGIMNPASVIIWQNNITWEMVISSYIFGLPFDLIHSLSSFVFLFVLSKSIMEKIERVKIKYGV